MHVLVTGATGFVGKALVRDLLAAGHQVTALVHPGGSTGAAGSLVHDLGSDAELRLPTGIDAVAHLAQSRAYRQFPVDAAEMFRVNVAGTQEVLEAAAAASVTAFCLISTGTVYEPFAVPLTEDAPLTPRSYLGASKLASEILARPFGGLFALSVLRLFMPYGPGQTGRLIPDLIRRVREGDAVRLPEQGDGLVFTPTFVDDICQVIIRALTEGWRGTLNVAAPGIVSIADAVTTIGQVLGRDVKIERSAMDAPRVVPDLTRLAARHDLARFRAFADGIRTMVAANAD